MVLPETKAELRKIFEETGQPPNKRIIEMQRNLIKLLGYDSDHGVDNLNKMGERYPNDYRLHMKMQSFAIAAQLACQ